VISSVVRPEIPSRRHPAAERPERRLLSRRPDEITQCLLDAAEAAGATADQALRVADRLLERRRAVRHAGDLAAVEIARRDAVELACTLRERVLQMSLVADRLDEELALWWAPQDEDAAPQPSYVPSYRVTVGEPEPLTAPAEGAPDETTGTRRVFGRFGTRRLLTRGQS
jgi:hypothetical protein